MQPIAVGRGGARLRLVGLVFAAFAAPAAHADHTEFFYELDSAHVVGNTQGGADCHEDFDSGWNGWIQAIGAAQVGGGLVTFENPGVHQDMEPFYDLILDREDIEAPWQCRLLDGLGDATLITEWVNHVPDLPGGFHGHMLVYRTANPEYVEIEGIAVSIVHLDELVASELGAPPGLSIAQTRILLDHTNFPESEHAQPMEFQTQALTESDLTGATGDRIYLKLYYDESAKTIVASYSLDGGNVYATPFTPISTAFSSAGEGRVWATGDPMTYVPEPSRWALLALGALALTALALRRR